MVVAIPTREWSVLLLHCGLQTHDARVVLWIVFGTASPFVDVGSEIVLLDDGNRIHWVCPSLWTDVLVGSDGDYELGLGLAESGTVFGGMAMGRIFGGQCDLESILLVALHETLRDCGLGLCAFDFVAQ